MPRIRAAITVQYRESDLCFIARLLAQEGLVFRFALNEEAPCGHTLLILADTTQPDSCPNEPAARSPAASAFIENARGHDDIEAEACFKHVTGLDCATARNGPTAVW